MKKRTLKIILGIVVFLGACGWVGVLWAILATIGYTFLFEWIWNSAGSGDNGKGED